MKYQGMTVNERLYLSGKLEDFDEAVAQKNTTEIIKILKAVELTESSIDEVLQYLKLKESKKENDLEA
jgi:Xaa-Pro aminopeptidase